ncbi:hypothetical protein EKO27_g3840 [Xylaria grammica]|uniref:DUF1203 domain-containing protein n=1 Tax=Xylaria grammica TaxID=363999 RepID=A0A439DA38_9PEZI|nr:hypothetical protein EKO27_g3840 [Xylaria grammica]
MAVTSTSTVTIDSEASVATNYGQQLPATLRWRPLPARLVEEEVPSPLAVLQTPDQPVPCRRCLQDSQVGDELLLLSYDPFLGDSPYRCASPIFVHSKPACEPAAVPASGGDIPEQLQKRLLAVRAYDGKHMMQGSEVVNGDSLLETCQRLLGDGTLAEYCHVHFATPGCFAVRIEKSSLPN